MALEKPKCFEKVAMIEFMSFGTTMATVEKVGANRNIHVKFNPIWGWWNLLNHRSIRKLRARVKKARIVSSESATNQSPNPKERD